MIEHAREDLFEGAVWYLTPGPRTTGVLFERLHRALNRDRRAADGDRRRRARPADGGGLASAARDRQRARRAGVPRAGRRRDVAGDGPGFRDATRIAGANPPLWADILLANREATVVQIDEAMGRLGDARKRWSKAIGTVCWRCRAKQRRSARHCSGAAGRGTAARAAHCGAQPARGDRRSSHCDLGRAGINISDMVLSPLDATHGEVVVWVPAEDDEIEPSNDRCALTR